MGTSLNENIIVTNTYEHHFCTSTISTLIFTSRERFLKKPTNHAGLEITSSCNDTMTFIHTLLSTLNVSDTVLDIKAAMMKRPYPREVYIFRGGGE